MHRRRWWGNPKALRIFHVKSRSQSWRASRVSGEALPIATFKMQWNQARKPNIRTRQFQVVTINCDVLLDGINTWLLAIFKSCHYRPKEIIAASCHVVQCCVWLTQLLQMVFGPCWIMNLLLNVSTVSHDRGQNLYNAFTFASSVRQVSWTLFPTESACGIYHVEVIY